MLELLDNGFVVLGSGTVGLRTMVMFCVSLVEFYCGQHLTEAFEILIGRWSLLRAALLH